MLPYSNVLEERAFSMVKKNKTPFKASMGFNTLRSILTVKLANLNADKAILKSAKRATLGYNERHASSSSTSTTKKVKKN